MKIWHGITFPSSELHLIEWMQQTNQIAADGLPAYQLHKYRAALEFTHRHRTAVDVGANIGMWSRVMALDFQTVFAFEPVDAFADCWRANVKAHNAHLRRVALGAAPGIVAMKNVTPNSCGDTTVDVGQVGELMNGVEMVTLDSLDLSHVDFLKADCEGYELFVMQGAVETIKRCRPTIVVEQKPGHGATFGLEDDAAVQFLKTLGMETRRVISGDYIMEFPR